MITDNKVEKIGESLFFNTEPNILLNVLSLQSFSDVTIGETVTRFFDKKFQYSFDGGVVFNNVWLDLTNPNLNSVVLPLKNNLVLKFRYTRVGSDTTGVLRFVSLNVDVNHNVTFDEEKKSLLKSVFSDIFSNNSDLQTLCVNITRKLYSEGIIPTYLTRSQNPNNINEDEDYVAFWKSISCFFSLIILHSRKLSNVYDNKKMIIEYLKQKGIFVKDELLVDLQDIANNINDEFRKRGTILPFFEKDQLILDDPNPLNRKYQLYNGEFLRLINYVKCQQEYCFTLSPDNRWGLNIGWISPLYRGTTQEEIHLNKLENKKKDIKDNKGLNVNSGTVNFNVLDNTLRLDDACEDPKNIRTLESIFASFSTEWLCIDDNNNYELTFWIKAVDSSNLDITVDGISNYLISTVDVSNNMDSNFVLTSYSVPLIGWFFVRILIFNKDQKKITDPNHYLLNIKWGKNLRLKVSTRKLRFNFSNSGILRFYDMKFRPADTPFSKGNIQSKNWLQIWTRNNNEEYSDEQISDITKRYLIPYNTNLALILKENNEQSFLPRINDCDC